MKILWAFNPFDDNKQLQKMSLEVLKWVSQPADTVTAVYVASPVELSLATAFEVPVVDRFEGYPEEQVESRLKSIRAKGIKATVVSNPSVSLTSSVKSFADFAEGKREDLIVIPTHARTGMARVVMGSFAESLVHFARTDILLFHPKTKTKGKSPTKLLYAHDFSRRAKMGFERALGYAKHWGASLDIVHLPEPSYGVKFKGQDPKTENYRSSVKAKARRIERQLAAAGVKGSVLIVTDWAPASEMIMKAARKHKADMILMAAQAGRLMALLGGSVTRQVVRDSKIPTLVLKV